MPQMPGSAPNKIPEFERRIYRRRRAAALAFQIIARALLIDVGWYSRRKRKGKSKGKGRVSSGGASHLIRKRWRRSRKGQIVWRLKHRTRDERRSALKRAFVRAARAMVRKRMRLVAPFRNWGGASERAYRRVAGTARRALFSRRVSRSPSNRPRPPTPRL